MRRKGGEAEGSRVVVCRRDGPGRTEPDVGLHVGRPARVRRGNKHPHQGAWPPACCPPPHTHHHHHHPCCSTRRALPCTTVPIGGAPLRSVGSRWCCSWVAQAQSGSNVGARARHDCCASACTSGSCPSAPPSSAWACATAPPGRTWSSCAPAHDVGSTSARRQLESIHADTCASHVGTIMNTLSCVWRTKHASAGRAVVWFGVFVPGAKERITGVCVQDKCGLGSIPNTTRVTGHCTVLPAKTRVVVGCK